jgi:uncharacterized protein YkwD
MTTKRMAILAALGLAAFLILRPVVGRLGEPEPPSVTGRSRVAPPPGAEPFGGPAPAVAGMPSEGASGAPVIAAAKGPAAAAAISHLPEVERRIFELTNGERRRAGLAALSPEPTLEATARAQSDDMIRRGFFDHVNPDGEAPEDRVASRHRRLIGLVGENLWEGKGYSAHDPAELAREIVQAWMKSPGHRANILRPESTHLGVGVAVAGDQTRATQNFATILAYVDGPVPERVLRGTVVPLAATPLAAASPRAELFDLWSPRTGLAASRPLALASGRLDAEPGIYKLRFYFPKKEHGMFAIYCGPRVEIAGR